ncbi:MAG TPA: acetoacetate--CoA ligase [Thermodesulfobacteriota bacterium]
MARDDSTVSPYVTPEGALLWEPSAEAAARSRLTAYLSWLGETKGIRHASYEEVWAWSVRDLEAFWGSVAEFFGVRFHAPPGRVLDGEAMPGARWFPGATLNYAEHALRRRDAHPALYFEREDGLSVTLTYAELAARVASVAAALSGLGVRPGDRVAAYLPNIPEAVVAFLATASLGAVWSSCPPEFGVRSVVERFEQIAPRVLLVADGYRYGGKAHDRAEAVAEIRRGLPSVERTVLIPYLDPRAGSRFPGTVPWSDLLAARGSLGFTPVPFDHPLWILYSSGTTGLPKGIVQGHGGIVLEHLKALALHLDLGPEDRFFWFTTTGWMMWNFLLGGLLVGSTVLLYDGSPGHPDLGALWRFAGRSGMTYFGMSAPYILACMKAGVVPAREADLAALRGVGSTGAPLPPEGFRWVYEAVKRDLLLGSVSGGTDVCTAFVLSCPLLPVRAGEIQCRGLGARVEAFDEAGRPVVGALGELVLTAPMPSMPTGFWNDPDGSRYRAAYFDRYPGVWRHGDWLRLTERGSCVIYGRSDSTLNRGGVRMGTSEFYRVVEELPEVTDSLVIDTGELGREGRLLLFVVLREEVRLDDALRGKIAAALRRQLSPRHVPDEIHAIAEVPRTLNGKKVEVPVKRILSGRPLEAAVSAEALANPKALEAFVALARGGISTPRRDAGKR